jgi:hypothetical protein
VDGKDGLREDFVGSPDQAFEHRLVREASGAFADLDDKRRLAVHVAAEKTHGLFKVIDIIGPDGILAIRGCKQLFGGDDHTFLLDIEMMISVPGGTTVHYTKSA